MNFEEWWENHTEDVDGILEIVNFISDKSKIKSILKNQVHDFAKCTWMSALLPQNAQKG